MNSIRKNAIIVGVLFLLAALTAIIGLILYQPILNDPDYIIKGSVNNIQVIWGAFFEIILVLSVIGISIMMYPILKMKNENIAIGYVCFRLLEGTIILIGIISLLSIVTLNQDFSKVPNQNIVSFLIAGKLLVAVHNWTFLFGPNFALGPSTLIMSYFLYKSKLVPRYISILGLVGGPLIFTCAVFVMFGVFLQVSVWGNILAVPVFAYEMSLAIWLIAKGFNSNQLTNSNEKLN